MVAIKILEKARIKDKKDIERISREIKILKKVQTFLNLKKNKVKNSHVGGGDRKLRCWPLNAE